MTKREKSLAGLVGALVVIAAAYAMADRLVLEPLARSRARAMSLAEQITEQEKQNARDRRRAERLGKLARRTYARDELTAREAIRARITDLAKQSGLSTASHWDLSPVADARKRAAYREVGWSVTARASLEHVVNFLYLLDADPRLHRVSNVTVTPLAESNDVTLRAKYTTLVLDDRYLPPRHEPDSVLSGPNLDDPERRRYQAIVVRDLFRPYIQRRIVHQPAPPPPRDVGQTESPPVEPEPEPPPEAFQRVVSLSNLDGRPHVCIRDSRSGELRYFRVGEALAGGRIAGVDYRELPLPDKPDILSTSRVIVRIGPTYWAIELGQTLSSKHRLSTEQLPQGLPNRATDPATDTKEVSVHAVNG